MSAEFQAMGLAFSIAELALKTGKLIRNVIQARTDADSLHHKVKHLRSLADRIGRILKSRQKAGPSNDPDITETIKAIKETLDECKMCLQVIEEALKDLADPGTGNRPPDFGKRIKFVCSSSFIETQQKAVKTHIDSLTINFIILQGLDQAANQAATHKALKQLTKALVRNASGQQATLNDLSLPDSDDDEAPPPIRDVSNDESEPEPPDLDLTNGCPECRRRNIVIPDTPLAMAVKHREAEIVASLIEAGEDIAVKDAHEWTLLHHATHNVDYPTTRHLLQSETVSSPQFLNATTQQEQTALTHVASQANAENSCAIAAELIGKGCDVNIQDSSEDRRTALCWAVDGSQTKDRERMVDLLIASGAKASPVRDGKLRDKAKNYARVQEAAKKEDAGGGEHTGPSDGTARAENAAADGEEKEGLGRRLTKVFSSNPSS